MKPVDVFHIGPPKTATTWIYRCLKEHPEIAAPAKDSTHFFDMFETRGEEWYASHFSHARAGQKRLDPTPSYVWSPKVPARIFEHNPDALIIFTLRNPIDRAFSHFWHLKKQGATNLTFDKILFGYDYFSTWLEPGFLGDAIQRYLSFFPKDQLHWILYEDIEDKPKSVFEDLCRFIGISHDFVPTVLDEKINVAEPRHTLRGRFALSIGRRLSQNRNSILSGIGGYFGESEKKPGVTVPGTLGYLTSGKKEYLRGIDPDLRSELQCICEPEIIQIEELLEIDLASWRSIR